jgi:hypothetical protein
MSGLSDEALEKEIQEYLMKKIFDMIENSEYSLAFSKPIAEAQGWKEVRVYEKFIEGFGKFKLHWFIDASGGRKYLDDLVFSQFWCC